MSSIAWALLAAAAGGCVDQRTLTVLPASGPPKQAAAVYFSGDAGVREGSGPAVTRALAAQGMPVYAYGSLALFGERKTRAQVDAIVADAVRGALARSGAERVVLVGKSFGADMLQTGLASLPEPLRARVGAVVLIVPSERVHFRADPLGVEYRRQPDSIGERTANLIDWAPLTCIYGRDESDSLCPHIRVAGARVVAMPGGHDLNRDEDGLVAHLLSAEGMPSGSSAGST